MGRKKKFIDKKKSATFHLLSRDSSDPNYDDTPGNDRVFVRVDDNNYNIDFFIPENDDGDSNSVFADAPDDVEDGDDLVYGGGSVKKAVTLPENIRKEILELGFPDDGYNYLSHLREIRNSGGTGSFYTNPKSKLDQVPLDVKAYDASRVRVSEVRSDEGNGNDELIYSVAAKSVGVRVQKVVDPDVAALLDDSDLLRFGSDVEDLEEDFVVRANQGDGLGADEEENLIEESEVINVGKYEFGSSSYEEKAVEYVCEEKVGSLNVNGVSGFVGEDVRVRRPLDDQFDLLEHQEYGSDGEDNDYGGYLAEEDESLANKLKNALNGQAVDDLELRDKYAVPADLLRGNEKPEIKELVDSAADVIRRCMEYAVRYENEDEGGDIVVVEESSDESEEWDCETIVSTYSNLENHPAKIGAPEIARKKKFAETVFGPQNAKSPVISLRGKEKLPVDFLPHKKSTTEKLKSTPALKTEHQKRKQHGQELKEEKKERKAAVKEEKREARRLKKETKELYRGEAQRAQKVAAIAGPSSIHLM